MNDFENFHVLHKALGDFWYSYFAGSEQVGTYVDSLQELHKQTEQTMHELEHSLSRHDIDIYHTVFNYPLKVKYSDYLNWSEVIPSYNGEYTYNGEIQYSVPVITSSRVKVPSNLVSIGSIANHITEPTIETTDFSLENSYLILPFNPFNEDFVIETLPDKDKEVTIWLKNVKFDLDDLYTQYGYAIGLKLQSSQRYKDIINAFTDCLVNGGSKANILKLVKAITGAEGELNPENIQGLAIPKGLLSDCIKDLVVINQDVPVEVTVQDGFTRVDLPLLGEDAKKFNDLAFERGKADSVEVIDDCELKQVRERLNG